MLLGNIFYPNTEAMYLFFYNIECGQLNKHLTPRITALRQEI